MKGLNINGENITAEQLSANMKACVFKYERGDIVWTFFRNEWEVRQVIVEQQIMYRTGVKSNYLFEPYYKLWCEYYNQREDRLFTTREEAEAACEKMKNEHEN